MGSKKVTMIVDLQYGSTGKGSIAGYLARREEADVVVSANMPNAGHTFIDEQGRKFVNKVLPSAAASPFVKAVLIGPGAVFDPKQLKKEIQEHRKAGYLVGVPIFIHENAVPLMEEHRQIEQESDELKNIGSTQQGSMAAMVYKLARDPSKRVIARDVDMGLDLWHMIEVITPRAYQGVLQEANHILAEGAQGFSLGINERFYPYCTSRDCTVARFLAEMAIPHWMLDDVIGTLRTYPIRVGGNSGGCYPDQREMTWDEVGVEPETTTVTGRVRRVFDFSIIQFREALHMNRPNHLFLNFVNYLKNEEIDDFIPMVDIIAHEFNSRLSFLGYGPTINDIAEV